MIANLKPYPVMKDSGFEWLGKIPDHWQMSPAFAAYSPKQVKNTGMLEKTVLSLSYGQIVVKPVERLHGLVPESFETYQIVDPGDIIVRTTDLQNDQTSLRVGISRHRGIITSAYLCLKTRDSVSSEYGYQLLNAYDLLKIIYGYGSGLRQNLDFSHIKRMPVPVPPPEEQKAIVRFLEYADRRIRSYIRAKQRLIKLLEEQRHAIIERVVTRGLDPTVPMRSSGVQWRGDIPPNWIPLQVRRVVSLVTSGSRGWAQYYSDDGDIFLQSGNLGSSMALNLSFVQHVRPPQGSEGMRTQVRKNDVLVCITGALTGNVALVDVDLPTAYVNQHVALIRPKSEKVVPKFLAYVLHSGTGKSQFKVSEYGGTKQGLGLDDVKSVVLAIPPLDEQQAITRHLDLQLQTSTGPITTAAKEIALTREYRSRLFSDVVTGKCDVRDMSKNLDREMGESIRASEKEEAAEEDELIEGDTEETVEEAEA